MLDPSTTAPESRILERGGGEGCGRALSLPPPPPPPPPKPPKPPKLLNGLVPLLVFESSTLELAP